MVITDGVPATAPRFGETKSLPRVGRWPQYDAAAEGLPEYWYPVLLSKGVGRKPVRLDLMGERLVFIRDAGHVYALHDRCPHRGTPLSMGRREFPGTIACRYHGWVFGLATGRLEAVLTDGPNSPMVGKACVRTYPVEERKGIIWVYLGHRTPPPIEVDMPEELLDPQVVVMTRITTQQGQWRSGVENGFDDGHAGYLHRDAIWAFFRSVPSWKTNVRVVPDASGQWLQRTFGSLEYEAEYPGFGRWPTPRFWRRDRQSARVSVRLPGIVRVVFSAFTAYKWCVPIDRQHFRYVQLVTRRTHGLGSLVFRAQYWLYRRWVYQGQFNGQDVEMIRATDDAGPEQFYRPDISIIAWRKHFSQARGLSQPGMEAPSSASEIHSVVGG